MNNDKPELRTLPMELRAQDDMKVGGYAVVFDSPSDGLPFEERIMPGAFRRSLEDRSQDIVMAWAHDLSRPLASRNAGSLSLSEDAKGLAFEARLNDTSWSKDAHAAIKSGAVRQVSFMFRVRPGGEQWDRESGRQLRRVTDAQLLEISPVVFATYNQTTVGVRSAADVLQAPGIAIRDALAQAIELERSF